MNNCEPDKLIGKIYFYCPACDKEHELHVYEGLQDTLIKGEKIEHLRKYLYCPTRDELFSTGKMMDENIASAKKKYKELGFE